MTALRDIQNAPRRKPRTVNDLSTSLIEQYGLPWRYQKRVERAERMIHLCNPIVRAYHTLSVTYHRGLHDGLYRRCPDAVCVQSRALVAAWGIDRKAMQSGKGRRSHGAGEGRGKGEGNA